MESALRNVYGDGAAAQVARYRDALSAFELVFGSGDVTVFRAPGRVNLIGEHTDYNHGFVLPVALDKDTLLFARMRSDNLVNLRNTEPDYPPIAFELTPDIPADPPGNWANYVKGAAQLLVRRLARNLRGLDGLVVGAAPHGVPRGSGLSSSSSLTVAAAVALAHFNGIDLDAAYGDQRMSRQAFARFCSEAEWYVGTRGGIMDQFIAVLGRRDYAMFLDCRPDAAGAYPTEHVPLPQGYRAIIVDSGVRHRNVGGGYNHRVAACRAGVALLRARYARITHLRDVQDEPWEEIVRCLPEETTVAELSASGVDLGDVPGLTADACLRVRARCRHVWTENRRVLDAMAAMRAGDALRLGRLLDEAHASARDDYEISCPELECLVHAAGEVEGVAGARLTGAGWGGCIVALVRADAVPAFVTHVTDTYRRETDLTAVAFDCRAGPGAGRVQIAAGGANPSF
jgi:galactokinase